MRHGRRRSRRCARRHRSARSPTRRSRCTSLPRSLCITSTLRRARSCVTPLTSSPCTPSVDDDRAVREAAGAISLHRLGIGARSDESRRAFAEIRRTRADQGRLDDGPGAVAVRIGHGGRRLRGDATGNHGDTDHETRQRATTQHHAASRIAFIFVASAFRRKLPRRRTQPTSSVGATRPAWVDTLPAWCLNGCCRNRS